MGTIIEKLNYLKETKEELKNLLKSNGVEINDDTTFREMIASSNDLINDFGNRCEVLMSELENSEALVDNVIELQNSYIGG